MDEFLSAWPWIVGALVLASDLAASVHVVLYKRDPRAAISWIGVIWLAPILGCFLYFALGINRIQRRARRMRRRRESREATPEPRELPVAGSDLLPADAAHLAPLVELVGAVTKLPLTASNQIEPLWNGDQSYPAMLQAIREAKKSVTLSVYIFDNDRAGQLFVDALKQAVARGVEVRVLIDDIGANYTRNSVADALLEAGVPCSRFNPSSLPWHFRYANLRNHRKLMVVDGQTGFTGGTNISEGNCLEWSPTHPIQDVHFRLAGPVVARLQEAFADDWAFSTGETLRGERWFPDLLAAGSIPARGISSGPDADLEKARLVFLGAVNCARTRVMIVTPYFLPDAGLVSALNIAALRGVRVDIVLPRQSDLRLVQWATTAQLVDVLEYGCKVWLTPPPFAHTKLVLVDGVWTLLGSANWDPRSLRLNFEFNVECYDRSLTTSLESVVRQSLERAHPVTLAQLHRRSFSVKLRDGIARLFTPYL